MAFLRLVSKEEIDEHRTLFFHGTLKQMLLTAGFNDSKICVSSFECGLNLYGFAEKA